MARRTHRTKVAVQRVRDPVPEEAEGGHGAGPRGQEEAQEGRSGRQGRRRRRRGCAGKRRGRRQQATRRQNADRGAPHGRVRQGCRAQAAPPDAPEEALLPRRGGAGCHPAHGTLLWRHLRLIGRFVGSILLRFDPVRQEEEEDEGASSCCSLTCKAPCSRKLIIMSCHDVVA